MVLMASADCALLPDLLPLEPFFDFTFLSTCLHPLARIANATIAVDPAMGPVL